jgi:hypothetical protein
MRFPLVAATLLGCGTTAPNPNQPPPSPCTVTHFDGTAAQVTLPDVGAAPGTTPFPELADSESIIGKLDSSTFSVIAYATLDMDGDHKPDLVITDRNAMPGVGTSKWLVYKNIGSGFAATPTEFALPDVGAAPGTTPFAQLADNESIIGNLDSSTFSVIAYSTLDMDGDGKPDLLITDRNAMPGVGTAKWLLYKNMGSGFAATPTELALPAVGADATSVPFAQLANDESIIGNLDSSTFSVIAYSTLDMDGDGKPDLVITERNAMPGVGTAKWLLYKNIGSGFDTTPTELALPSVGADPTSVPFAQLANDESILGKLDSQTFSVIAYVTTDLDGDHKPDLVLTSRNAVADIGTHSWQVFHGDAHGFAATPTEFALPDVGAAADAVPFAKFADNESIVGRLDSSTFSVITYAPLDLDGDSKPDLVLTTRNAVPGIGEQSWQVFHGACSP